MDERLYYLGFSLFSGIGPVTFSKLLARFGSAKDAWNASRLDLEPFLKTLTNTFEDFKKSFPFNGYKKELKRKNAWFVVLCDSEYPELLKQSKKPPIVLFGKGNKKILGDYQTIAVVGTRKITEYGKEVTELFVSGLVQNGFTIVSGLAMGVDAVAHKTTLDNNGSTIAVLGCGVDCCTPEENSKLYDQILKSGGVIVSELPLGHSPTKGSFPSRNRIIAGLSLGVLVTEGAEDSGSLITADYALSESRRVFAIPGPITSSLSKGPFSLIKKGAKLVTNPEEIVKEFKSQNSKGKITVQNAKVQRTNEETKEERKILELLRNEVMHFDQIGRKTNIPSSKLGTILSLMEMKGMIKNTQSVFSISNPAVGS